MIGKLIGIIDEIFENYILINVNNVCYKVFTPSIYNFKVNQKISLYIETIVKEDEISLYGFKETIQQKVFNLLMTVQGIGAKSALSILNQDSISSLCLAIYNEDKNYFKNVSGVGPKTASKIIIDLAQKIPQIHNTNNQDYNIINESVTALVGLGFNQIDAQNAVENAYNQNKNITLEQMISFAIKNI